MRPGASISRVVGAGGVGHITSQSGGSQHLPGTICRSTWWRLRLEESANQKKETVSERTAIVCRNNLRFHGRLSRLPCPSLLERGAELSLHCSQSARGDRGDGHIDVQEAVALSGQSRCDVGYVVMFGWTRYGPAHLSPMDQQHPLHHRNPLVSDGAVDVVAPLSWLLLPSCRGK